MKIFELEIPRLRYSQFFKEITHHLTSKKQSRALTVCTPNPEICLKTLEDREFLALLTSSDYLTSDGIGLYLGYQIMDNSHGKLWNILLLPKYIFKILFFKTLLYEQYGDRICGSDITDDLLNFCEQKGIHIAILDPSYPDDAAKCEAQESFHANLATHFPYLHFEMYVYSEENKDTILKKIAKSEAQVLFSTLGMKKQEESIFEAIKICPNIKLALGVGSSFDYFTGFQKRAPHIWRQ
jgi:N-acetylglucosaminyldiphosphoundecaprenol N-acetyl-beta-D-mannosaminyltransferase